MREIAEELRQWREAGEDVAMATVVETWGSSPRPLGSKMLATTSGKMAGSVSNGCVEGAVFEAAQEVLASRRPRLVEYGVTDDVAFEVGLACGGHIEVLIQPVGETHDRALSLLASEQPFLLRSDLGSGSIELVERSPDFELARREGDTFWEPFGRPAQMVIVGAIHIAVPLHRMAKLMGYRVTVVDARGQFATRERFPEARSWSSGRTRR
jgi:xanthine dehydrogenase accessory factor